jgi:hypothetical protein
VFRKLLKEHDRLGERLDQLVGARGESVSYGDTKHHQSHHVAN